MLKVNYGAPRSVDVHGDGQPDTAPSTEECVRHVHLHAPYLLYIPAFLFDLATANLEICRNEASFSEAAGQRHLIPSPLRLSPRFVRPSQFQLQNVLATSSPFDLHPVPPGYP